MNYMPSIEQNIIVLIGVLFPLACTAVGSALVVFLRTLREDVKGLLLGLSSGIMLAASVWSLIIPALELSEDMAVPGWITVGLGILAGAAVIALLDAFLRRWLPTCALTGSHRTLRFFCAVTLHNIPEGLAVGIGIGGMLASGTPAARLAAIALSLGIGLQNIPEGAAVAFAMRQDKSSRRKSFAFGALSGVVEPIAAVAGIALASSDQSLMPWILAAAAGAMLLVLFEDLIPESQAVPSGQKLATAGALAGFIVMLAMDVALG